MVGLIVIVQDDVLKVPPLSTCIVPAARSVRSTQTLRRSVWSNQSALRTIFPCDPLLAGSLMTMTLPDAVNVRR